MEALESESDLRERGRIFDNAVHPSGKCIKLHIDADIRKELSPFAFHFELDREQYARNKRDDAWNRYTYWLHWFAVYHHRFGFRHLLLISILTAFTCIGGLIFNELEADNEIRELQATVHKIQNLVELLTNETLYVGISNASIDAKREEISIIVQDYYKLMLDTENRYSGSAFHKYENFDLHRTWHYGSATFYAMTLFTTIGYGTIACTTFAGQAFSLIYAAIGIPLMLVVLTDVGNLMLHLSTFLYVRVLVRVKRIFGMRIDTTEGIELPFTVVLVIILTYMMMCACVVHYFDWKEGHYEGLPLWDSFYFSTISFFTIGLGDIMPNNIQYSPFLAAMFLGGLAMVGMINSSMYSRMEHRFFGAIARFEELLDHVHASHQRGHTVFQHLASVFKIAVIAIPEIPEVIEYVYDGQGRRSLGIQVNILSRRVSRAHSVAVADLPRPKVATRPRAPTLLGTTGLDFAKVLVHTNDTFGDC